jgi:transcription antitermination factor NusG
MAVAYLVSKPFTKIHSEETCVTWAPSFWCALYVMPHHEMTVARILSNEGYEQFMPTYSARRKWSDRLKILELPLFPGYVFCRVQKETAGGVLKLPGVHSIVGFGGKICAIDDREIEILQQIVTSGRDFTSTSYWNVGDKVEITEGPLAGIVGTLRFVKNRCQLVISVDMLMQSAAVTIHASEAKPVVMRTA